MRPGGSRSSYASTSVDDLETWEEALDTKAIPRRDSCFAWKERFGSETRCSRGAERSTTRATRSGQLDGLPVSSLERLRVRHAGPAPDHLDVEAVGIVKGHDPHRLHVADVSVGRAFRLDAATDLAKRLLRRRQEGEVVEAATPEHRPRRGRQGRPLEDLEGMKDGGRADLEENVPDALLGHVERLRRIEDAFVERRQAV